MGALKTIAAQPALQGLPIAHDQARELLGRVMGPRRRHRRVHRLGAYLGRDLSGATGLVLFIAAFACIISLQHLPARAQPVRRRPARLT